MASQALQERTITALADRIHTDIRDRRLDNGDRYLTLTETARMLHVSTSSASRALRLLHQRGVLDRKQRQGTFIADLSGKRQQGELQRLHLVTHKGSDNIENMLVNEQVIGLQGVFPNSDIVFNFLPLTGIDEYIQQLVEVAHVTPGQDGFVAASVSLSVVRTLVNSGLPTVILGTPFAFARGVPWIDRDHRQEASLAVDYLAAWGAEKFVFLQGGDPRGGYYSFLDAMLQKLGEKDINCANVFVRQLMGDIDTKMPEIATLLKKHSGSKWGIATYGRSLLEAAIAAVKACGLSLGEDVALVPISNLQAQMQSISSAYPHVMFEDEPEQIGRRCGELLKAYVAKGEYGYVELPVKLVIPDE